MSAHRPNAPPSRNGVGASSVVLTQGPWTKVIDFLVQRFPSVSHATWLQRLQVGDVVVLYSESTLAARTRIREVDALPGAAP